MTLRDYPETDQSIPALYARAYAYHSNARVDLALDAADQLLAKDPPDPYFLELKGQVLLESGRPLEALEPLRRATALTNAEPLIASLFGHALIATEDDGNFAEAERVLRAAVGRDRRNPFAWYQLGVVYAARGDTPQARLASAEQQVMSGQYGLALRSAQAAEYGLEHGTPDWIRARHRHAGVRCSNGSAKWNADAIARPAEATKGSPMRQHLQTALIALAFGFVGAGLWSLSGLGHGQTREYLVADPQILSEMSEAYQRSESEGRLAARCRRGDASHSPGRCSAIRKAARVLVKFTDYGCTYCRQSIAAIDRTDRRRPRSEGGGPRMADLRRQRTGRAHGAGRQAGQVSCLLPRDVRTRNPSDANITRAAQIAELDVEQARARAASDDATGELRAIWRSHAASSSPVRAELGGRWRDDPGPRPGQASPKRSRG